MKNYELLAVSTEPSVLPLRQLSSQKSNEDRPIFCEMEVLKGEEWVEKARY